MTLDEYKQALARAAQQISSPTVQDVRNAAQYAFGTPSQDDLIRMMRQAQQQNTAPTMDAQAASMAGTPTQANAPQASATPQAPASIERAIQLQDDPDKLTEHDVLYQLPTKGLTSWGPADIYRRPFVDNDDGTTSTMVSSIFDDDGGYHVIANVGSDGTMYEDDDAVKRAQDVGDNVIANFDNLEDAEAFDNALHPREVMRLKYRNNPQALSQYAYDLERADHPERFDANGNYISNQQAQSQPTQQEAAAVSQQAAPVASQAAQMAAQAQNQDQLNNIITQARALGMDQNPMSWGERGVYSQILGAKDMYNAAQDDAGRATAHSLADAYRQMGRRYGVDDATANLNADQLRALLQTDYDMGVSNAMQGQTSGEYFDDQYNALRKAGLTRREAEDEAARRAAQYQDKRVRNLTNAYYMYGVNSDGSMNNNGAAILNLIYDEQPSSAAMGMQNYATPIQNWKFGKNMEAANNAYQQKLDYGQHNFDWTKALKQQGIDAQEAMLTQQLNARQQLAQLQANTQKDIANAKLQAAKEAAAVKAASGSGGSSKSSGSGGGKLTAAQQTTIDSAINQLAEAESVINGDQWDNEGDGKELESVRSDLQKQYDDGKIPYETWVEDIYPRLAALETAYQHKYGYKGQGE